MKSIAIPSYVVLECACEAGDVFILVDGLLTVSGFDFIMGRAASMEFLVDNNNVPYYLYGISYDETQLKDANSLDICSNIKGISCKC